MLTGVEVDWKVYVIQVLSLNQFGSAFAVYSTVIVRLEFTRSKNLSQVDELFG